MSQQLLALRHTAEHVLHQAVKELYPQIHLAMGPATDDGFYFDFDPQGVTISETDFPQIEQKMRQIINQDLPLTRQEISQQKARKLFADNPYKLDWLDRIQDRGEKVTIYWTGAPEAAGSMVDLCAGPHVASTGHIKAFKLLSVAGAYWHGDENNKMLTRIYGTAFPTQAELDQYLANLAEAKLRDHRKLGQDLNLFTFSDLVGKGLPLFTEKGTTIRREIERFIVDEEINRGYKHVHTPNIAKTDLYKKSGHYPYYADTMYPPMKVDEDELILRPMTCPHHFALFMDRPRSYRDLPLRFAELASLYRYEKSGELTGLMRVREFVLADAHIFVRKQDAHQEIASVLDLIEYAAAAFTLKPGKNFVYRLSLGDRNNKDKYFDAPTDWDQAEAVLKQVLVDRKANFYEAPGEAAFYGPKIDVQMKNVLGKEDTAFTVQYDFCLPHRFTLTFTNEQGEPEQPVVIHRSSVGALERSIAFLIEHFAGAFPVWLAPTQVQVIPISERHEQYAQDIVAKLRASRIRVELDAQAESMQKKIRNAELQKIPYIIVVGDREQENQQINLRTRGLKDQQTMSVDQFLSQISAEISSRMVK